MPFGLSRDIVRYGDGISEVVSEMGGNVSIDTLANITTESTITQGEYTLKAIATSNKEGETCTKFVLINSVMGEEIELDRTLKEGESFEIDNKVRIFMHNEKLHIRIKSPLIGELIVE